MRRLAPILLLGVVALVAALLWPSEWRGVSTPAEVVDTSAITYRVLYRSSQSTRLTADTRYGAELLLRGELLVRQLPDAVGFRFGDATVAMTLDGQAADVALSTDELIATLDDEGRVTGFRGVEATPSATDRLLRVLALEWAHEGASSGERRTPHGLAEVRCEHHEHTDTCDRARYLVVDAAPDVASSEVHARATATRDAGGLRTLEADERLRGVDAEGHDTLVLTTHFEARREGRRAVGPVLAAFDHAVEMRNVDAEIDAAHYRAAAAGLSGEALLDAIAVHGNGGQIPDHDRFLWQAVARLRLEPELGASLRALYVDADTNDVARALVLDLLVHAGTPELQGTLVELLDRPETTESPDALMLVQRLTFVERPTAETLAYVARRFEGAEGEMRDALAYATGAAVLHAGPEEAATLHATLREELDTRPSEHVIIALGVAGDPSDTEVLTSFAREGDVSQRRAAAEALGRLPAGSGREALLEGLGDESPDVRTSALASLATHGFDADVLDVARRRVEEGTLGEESIDRVFGALRDADPEATRALLEALVARGITRPSLRARAHAWLEDGAS
ncbi:MAG: HEAT repeat domain-containing protein [Myxococcales bacterium]|nr:HEAT repeat domain-containing protein [Myxococcales bacterium]